MTYTFEPVLGIDYSFARPNPAAIFKAGYRFVVRYLGPDTPAERGKLLTVPERDEIENAGLGWFLTFEDGVNNALGGAAQGKIDGEVAKAQADALGYPAHSPIFAAVDFDALSGNEPVIGEYLKAFAAASGRVGGDYGDEDSHNACLADTYWESEAWDGTNVSALASLYQRIKPTHTIAGAAPGSYDEDLLLKPLQWAGPNSPTKAPPAPKPEPKPTPAPPTGGTASQVISVNGHLHVALVTPQGVLYDYWINPVAAAPKWIPIRITDGCNPDIAPSFAPVSRKPKLGDTIWLVAAKAGGGFLSTSSNPGGPWAKPVTVGN